MTLADKNLTQLANLTAKLTNVHLSYLASLIREDLADGVMAWVRQLATPAQPFPGEEGGWVSEQPWSRIG